MVISSRQLVLLLIGVTPSSDFSSSIGGITRLQKFLFLLQKEEGLKESETGFSFEPYKAGPYSSRLYDELEFLENLGMIGSEIVAESTEAEKSELELLSFDDLMADESEYSSNGRADGFGASDAFEERKYFLTERGAQKVKALLADPKYQPLSGAIRKIKSKYGSHSLNDLLYYVYNKYPEMTTESEIRDKVLNRGK